jgi:hypothetical protein
MAALARRRMSLETNGLPKGDPVEEIDTAVK